MRETTLLNAISVVAGSLAISVACKATRSGWPLFAFLILPRWNFSQKPVDEGKAQNINNVISLYDEKKEGDDGDRS